ncbi:hypothetical protein ACJ73_03825, partial [Blastomyces percursus]
ITSEKQQGTREESYQYVSKLGILQKQETHYPPPSRTTCENYRKYQKSRAGKKGKQGKLEQKQDG